MPENISKNQGNGWTSEVGNWLTGDSTCAAIYV